MKLKDLKYGEFFTKKEIENPKETQVWVRDAYNPFTKKYIVYRFSDINDFQEIPGTKEIYTNFIF